MQFGGKYKLANSVDLYLGYTQTMFWSIYSNSQPFKDINYSPDIFYRLIEDDGQFIKSIDLGFVHSSNGKNAKESRSLHRLYVKSNVKMQIGRHLILGNFMAYDVISAEEYNKNIKDYLGYWSFSSNISHIIVHQKQRLDFEFKIFSGKKVFNFNKGGQTIGAFYHLGSEHFNPSFYLQFYNGYLENLLEYQKKSQQFRLGFLLYI